MRRAIQVAAVLVMAYVLYFYGLSRTGLLGPDEPRYASIGREMAESGDWVTPRLWGRPWFEKPALLYWMIGAAYQAGLGDDLAARVPVAVCSALFLAFFFFELRREFGEAAAGYATAILGTSAGWLAYGQVGVTDAPMSAAFAACMILAMRWIRSGGRRGLLLAGMLLGIAVLAKGLVPLVLALPLAWAGRKRWKDLTVFALGCAAVASPWYVLCTLRNGRAFLDEFFLRHHFARFGTGDLLHVQPFWYYAPVMLGLLFPWTPVLTMLLTRRGWADPRRFFLLLWILWGFVFFSAAANKLPGYVLPLLPAIAALGGILLAERANARWVLVSSAAMLVLIPIAAQVLAPALRDGLSAVDFRGISWRWSVAPIVLAIILSRAPVRAGALAIAAAATFAVLLLKQYTYPELDYEVSARRRWEILAARGNPECIPPVSRSLHYGLSFYAGRALVFCNSESSNPDP